MKKPLKVDLSGFFIFPVVVSLNCLLTNSLVIYLRYAFASNPFQVRSLEWELHGTYYGLTWDLLGRSTIESFSYWGITKKYVEYVDYVDD